MKHKATILIIVLCCVFMLFQQVFAKVSAEEAAKLKTTLTPLGGEKAGNKEGTIPAWNGGLTKVPPGYKSGQRRPDPFANEKPIVVITSKNMDQHADKLTEGNKFLLKKYPDYRMDVYPSHRTNAAPQYVYDNTFKNATRATTTNNGLTCTGAYKGIPFPIPKTGNEAMFNHLLAWQGEAAYEPFKLYLVEPDGKRVLGVEAENYQQYPYYFKDVPMDKWNGEYWNFRQLITAPPFKAGESMLLRDPVDMYGKGRRGWQYLTGQRRTRRAPSIAYDTPDFVASGQQYFDEPWVFIGSLDRYTWKLIGKKEMYVPYNCNKFYLAKKDSEILGKQFLNPDYMRWELHRVWLVEATLAPGKRHVVPKRIFYLDEDCWKAILCDAWDGHGQLWRYTITAPLALPEMPGVVPISFGVYNLQTGTRTMCNVINEMPVEYEIRKPWPDSFFSPDALAGTGVR